MSSHYINTDLIIRTAARTEALEAELARRANLMYSNASVGDTWQVSAAARGSSDVMRKGRSPESHIVSLLDALDALPEVPQEALGDALEVTFDVGWQSASDRPEGTFGLSPETLARLAARRATLVVTIYPSVEDESAEFPALPPTSHPASRRRK